MSNATTVSPEYKSTAEPLPSSPSRRPSPRSVVDAMVKMGGTSPFVEPEPRSCWKTASASRTTVTWTSRGSVLSTSISCQRSQWIALEEIPPDGQPGRERVGLPPNWVAAPQRDLSHPDPVTPNDDVTESLATPRRSHRRKPQPRAPGPATGSGERRQAASLRLSFTPT